MVTGQGADFTLKRLSDVFALLQPPLRRSACPWQADARTDIRAGENRRERVLGFHSNHAPGSCSEHSCDNRDHR
jgi:hypothetical protein